MPEFTVEHEGSFATREVTFYRPTNKPLMNRAIAFATIEFSDVELLQAKTDRDLALLIRERIDAAIESMRENLDRQLPIAVVALRTQRKGENA